MYNDAAAATATIVRNRKLEKAKFWKRCATSFECASGARLLFTLVVLTELYTSSIVIAIEPQYYGLMGIVYHIYSVFRKFISLTRCFLVCSCTVPLRVMVFIYVSFKHCPRNWWRYWVTMDNIFLITVVTSVIYGYMLLALPPGTDLAIAGDFIWRLLTVATFPMILVAANGNFRIMVKVFPWTPLTIMIYKSLRVYAAVVGTVVELQLYLQPVSGMNTDLLILYVAQLVSYNISMLARISSWTAWQRSLEAKAKAANDAGVKLTLDEVENGKSPKTLSVMDSGYQSYDEQNDSSVQFYQQGQSDPVVATLLGTNDDSSIPADISTIRLLNPAQGSESDTDGYL